MPKELENQHNIDYRDTKQKARLFRLPAELLQQESFEASMEAHADTEVSAHPETNGSDTVEQVENYFNGDSVIITPNGGEPFHAHIVAEDKEKEFPDEQVELPHGELKGDITLGTQVVFEDRMQLSRRKADR